MLLIFVMMLSAVTHLQNKKSIDEIRESYEAAIYDGKKSKELIAYFNGEPSSQPLYLAYEGAARMVHAKHVFFPFDKLATYNKGKELLEAAVSKAPDNMEIRYLRLSIQDESPSFLGYKNNIEEDKKFLIKNFNKLRDKDNRLRIQNFLLKNFKLTETEKQLLNESN